MPNNKEYYSIYINKDVKELIKIQAEAEGTKPSLIIEKLIKEYLKEKGLDI